MKFMKIRAPDFDLEKTLESGQVFHWQKVGDGFVGAIGDLPVYVEQRGEFLKDRDGEAARSPGRPLPGIVARYFALDHPLAEICDSFPKDPVVNAARKFCHGLRIIRQPKWECLATFICSSMKQVAHIRQFSGTYFGEHGGYAQQYLFHQARSGGRENQRRARSDAPYLMPCASRAGSPLPAEGAHITLPPKLSGLVA